MKNYTPSQKRQRKSGGQALVLIFAAMIILTNLFVDLLYAWLDPRIRYERTA